MLHFKNSCRPHLAALLHTLYMLSAQFGCLISACHLPGVTNTLTDTLSRGWLRRFFELCTYADHTPTSIIKCNLDFSDWDMAGARWPCRDVGVQLLAACDVGYSCRTTISTLGGDSCLASSHSRCGSLQSSGRVGRSRAMQCGVGWCWAIRISVRDEW